MSLQLLEEDLTAHLLSGITITSVVQCVEELVYNSIDSGAFDIAVRIDIPRYTLQVRSIFAENALPFSLVDYRLLCVSVCVLGM